MTLLLTLFLLFLGFVIVPLILLKLFIRLVLGIAILPFKLAGGVVSLTGKILHLALRLVFAALGLVFCLLLLPLLPLLLIGGLAYLVASSLHPHALVVRP